MSHIELYEADTVTSGYSRARRAAFELPRRGHASPRPRDFRPVIHGFGLQSCGCAGVCSGRSGQVLRRRRQGQLGVPVQQFVHPSDRHVALRSQNDCVVLHVRELELGLQWVLRRRVARLELCERRRVHGSHQLDVMDVDLDRSDRDEVLVVEERRCERELAASRLVVPLLGVGLRLGDCLLERELSRPRQALAHHPRPAEASDRGSDRQRRHLECHDRVLECAGLRHARDGGAPRLPGRLDRSASDEHRADVGRAIERRSVQDGGVIGRLPVVVHDGAIDLGAHGPIGPGARRGASRKHDRQREPRGPA